MTEIIINILGYILLWIAVDTGRTEDSKISYKKREFYGILFLITIASLMIKY